jgi:hypothetical protein
VDRERVNRLMMAALDGEIATDERDDLDRVLERHPEIRQEYRMMQRVKEVTGTMTYREPPEEIWDRYWVSIYNRLERGIGWILISVGAIALLSWGAWRVIEALWGDAGIPVGVKLAIFAVAAGLLILAVSVVREKLFTYRHDPYKEIER